MFYKNGEYDKFDDLILIKKSEFDDARKKRDAENKERTRIAAKAKSLNVLGSIKKKRIVENC